MNFPKANFHKIMLPAMEENLAYLNGVEPSYSKREIFKRLELLPHQAALISTITRKIRDSRQVEQVLGYSSERFNHEFFASDSFIHPDDFELSAEMTKSALFNELKSPRGSLKTEYSFYSRYRHASGANRLLRYSIFAFDTILHGIPTSALIILSDMGEGRHSLPANLHISHRSPLVETPDGRLIHRDMPFTYREREVLYGLCTGKSSKMIGDELNIAKKTVDNMRASLLERSGAANVAELSSRAMMHNWI